MDFFGNEKDIFSDADTWPFETFPYVRSLIEQMMHRYEKTHVLSAEDYAVIQQFHDGFYDLYNVLIENPNISQEQFGDCIDALNDGCRGCISLK